MRGLLPYAPFYLGGALLIYHGSLGGEFIFDDSIYVVNNYLIKNFDLHGIARIFTSFYQWDYLPVTLFSFSLDYWVYGLNPSGYHLTNILLHVSNAALLHLVIFRITGSKFPAAAAALLFLLHPVHVESVAWISERKNVLSCFFLLASFYCYLLNNRRFFVVLFFLLACLSKSSAVMFPLLMVLYDLSFTARKPSLFQNIPCFAISASAGALTFMTHSRYGTVREHPDGDPLNTFYSMIVVFKEYLSKLLLPVNLNVWYPDRVFTSLLNFEGLLSCMVMGFFIILAASAFRRFEPEPEKIEGRERTPLAGSGGRILFFGLSWFVISLLPVSHIIPFPQMMADRFLYIPSAGLFLAAAVWIGEMRNRSEAMKILLGVFSGVVLLSYAGLSWNRIPVFQDDIALWRDSLARNPDNTYSMMNLGLAYWKKGDDQKALEKLAQAIEIEPKNNKAARASAVIHEGREDYGAARKIYLELIKKTPNNPVNHILLGTLHGKRGNYEEAILLFNKALILDPDSAPAHYNRAEFLYLSGRSDLALRDYQRAAQLQPDSVQYQYQLGMFHLRILKNPEGARFPLEKSLRLDPDQSNARALRKFLYGPEDSGSSR